VHDPGTETPCPATLTRCGWDRSACSLRRRRSASCRWSRSVFATRSTSSFAETQDPSRLLRISCGLRVPDRGRGDWRGCGRWDIGTRTHLLGALRQDLLDLLEPAVRRWLDQYWVPLDTLTQIQARTVYLELATTPWRAGAACYAGDVEACRVALALGAGGPESWYTAEERRQLVASAMEYHADVQRDLGAQRCVNTADEQACLETLRSYPALTDEPLSPMARQTLVRVAFGVGGNGAFGRFVRSDSRTLPDRLAHTAGVPLDSLVVRWRSAIVEARPTGTVLSRLGGWTAFMWVVVLSVVAMRSTRWRIR
jgi:hypothetical protein